MHQNTILKKGGEDFSNLINEKIESIEYIQILRLSIFETFSTM